MERTQKRHVKRESHIKHLHCCEQSKQRARLCFHGHGRVDVRALTAPYRHCCAPAPPSAHRESRFLRTGGSSRSRLSVCCAVSCFTLDCHGSERFGTGCLLCGWSQQEKIHLKRFRFIRRGASSSFPTRPKLLLFLPSVLPGSPRTLGREGGQSAREEPGAGARSR